MGLGSRGTWEDVQEDFSWEDAAEQDVRSPAAPTRRSAPQQRRAPVPQSQPSRVSPPAAAAGKSVPSFPAAKPVRREQPATETKAETLPVPGFPAFRAPETALSPAPAPGTKDETTKHLPSSPVPAFPAAQKAVPTFPAQNDPGAEPTTPPAPGIPARQSDARSSYDYPDGDADWVEQDYNEPEETAEPEQSGPARRQFPAAPRRAAAPQTPPVAAVVMAQAVMTAFITEPGYGNAAAAERVARNSGWRLYSIQWDGGEPDAYLKPLRGGEGFSIRALLPEADMDDIWRIGSGIWTLENLRSRDAEAKRAGAVSAAEMKSVAVEMLRKTPVRDLVAAGWSANPSGRSFRYAPTDDQTAKPVYIQLGDVPGLAGKFNEMLALQESKGQSPAQRTAVDGIRFFGALANIIGNTTRQASRVGR